MIPTAVSISASQPNNTINNQIKCSHGAVLCTDLWPVQVVRLSVWWLVPLELLGERQDGAHKPEHRVDVHHKYVWAPSCLKHSDTTFTLSKYWEFLFRHFFYSNHTRLNSKPMKHTCWWSRCSSSWAGSRSWAPRRRAAWCGRRGPTRCGWLRGTWRRNCPGSRTCRGACVSCGWCPGDPPVPLRMSRTQQHSQ